MPRFHATDEGVALVFVQHDEGFGGLELAGFDRCLTGREVLNHRNHKRQPLQVRLVDWRAI